MFHHISVLLEESIEALNIREDGIYVDCTLGGAGHSAKILEKLTTGHLYGFDQDIEAIEAARQRLEKINSSFTLIHDNFVHMKEDLTSLGVTEVDGVLFDLGVSSHQFDMGYRGFSYQHDARLDMRMDQDQTLDAYHIVNEYPYEQLVFILERYGDEKFAKPIARKIEQQRSIQPIETTLQLVDVIKSALPAYAKRKAGHPAKKTFQALRIAVNDELNVFEKALEDALNLLKPSGRVAIITFHSLEDRICKHILMEKTQLKDIPKGLPVIPENMLPQYRLVYRKPIEATEEELAHNHRAHSAKLRVIERIEKHG